MKSDLDSHEHYDEISCGGVPIYIKSDGRPDFLLVLHNGPYKYWAFPKGRQNSGESFKETAIRELKEETGISNFKILKRLISDSIYFPKRGTKTIIKKVVFYLVRFYTQDVTLSTEHISWKWVSFEKALSLLTFNDYIRVLKESNELILKESIF
ncbi:MAG: bis(5'-nucleosyl)-tetraphosphatase [Candidatus Hodarchaeales archaeon]